MSATPAAKPQKPVKKPKNAQPPGGKPVQQQPVPAPRGRSFAIVSNELSQQQLQDVNSIVKESVRRATNIMENKIADNNAALLDLTSANFGAANFGAAEFSSSLLAKLGHVIPASTPEAAIAVLNAVARRVALHPKRFGSKGTSMVIQNVSQNIFTVPTSGTGGYVDGNDVVVAFPINSAYKGAIIYAINPTTRAWSVIGYVTPDRDPEEISTSLACLFSQLSISAPSVVGGTSINVAQLMLQLGVTCVAPTAIVGGKMAPVSRNRKCPTVIVGAETHTEQVFTATLPENAVKRYSSYDPQNRNIVATPSAQPTRPSAYPEPVVALVINANGADVTKLTTSGFNPDIFNGASSGVIGGVEFDLWKLSRNDSAWRHILYGDIEFEASIAYIVAAGTLNIKIYVDIQNGDGTITTLDMRTSNPSPNTNRSFFKVNTCGDSRFNQYTGKVISDIRLVTDGVGTFEVFSDPIFQNYVNVRFLAVHARTEYMVGFLSGIRSGYRVAIDVSTDTEVLLATDADNASFLSPTDDLPYPDTYLPAILRAADLTEDMPALPGDAVAGGFLRKMKKIGKVASHVAKNVAPFVPGTAGRLLMKGGNALGHAVDLSSNPGNFAALMADRVNAQ